MGFLRIPMPSYTPLLFRYIPAVLAQGLPSPAPPSSALDPSFKRIMVYVFVASRGGQNRARIAQMLKDDPSNLNKIAEKLSLDYKTVSHHVKVLEDNGVIVSSSKGSYGAVYFLTPYFEKYFEPVRAMWERFGQN